MLVRNAVDVEANHVILLNCYNFFFSKHWLKRERERERDEFSLDVDLFNRECLWAVAPRFSSM